MQQDTSTAGRNYRSRPQTVPDRNWDQPSFQFNKGLWFVPRAQNGRNINNRNYM